MYQQLQSTFYPTQTGWRYTRELYRLESFSDYTRNRRRHPRLEFQTRRRKVRALYLDSRDGNHYFMLCQFIIGTKSID